MFWYLIFININSFLSSQNILVSTMSIHSFIHWHLFFKLFMSFFQGTIWFNFLFFLINHSLLFHTFVSNPVDSLCKTKSAQCTFFLMIIYFVLNEYSFFVHSFLTLFDLALLHTLHKYFFATAFKFYISTDLHNSHFHITKWSEVYSYTHQFLLLFTNLQFILQATYFLQVLLA